MRVSSCSEVTTSSGSTYATLASRTRRNNMRRRLACAVREFAASGSNGASRAIVCALSSGKAAMRKFEAGRVLVAVVALAWACACNDEPAPATAGSDAMSALSDADIKLRLGLQMYQ